MYTDKQVSDPLMLSQMYYNSILEKLLHTSCYIGQGNQLPYTIMVNSYVRQKNPLGMCAVKPELAL